MFVVAHAAAGSVIGSVVSTDKPKGWTRLILYAVLSHIVLDLVPHWDYTPRLVWIALDLLASLFVITIVIFIAHTSKWPVIVGSLAATAPDLDVLFVHLGILESKFFVSHLSWFPHGELAAPWGIIIQILFIMGCIGFIVLRFAKKGQVPPAQPGAT